MREQRVHRDPVDLEADCREPRLEGIGIGTPEERCEAGLRLLLHRRGHRVPEGLQLGRLRGVEIDGELRPDRLADRTELLLELLHQFRGHRAAVLGEELLVRGAGLREPRLPDRLHGLLADAGGSGVLSTDRGRGDKGKHRGGEEAGGEASSREVHREVHGDPSIEDRRFGGRRGTAAAQYRPRASPMRGRSFEAGSLGEEMDLRSDRTRLRGGPFSAPFPAPDRRPGASGPRVHSGPTLWGRCHPSVDGHPASASRFLLERRRP